MTMISPIRYAVEIHAPKANPRSHRSRQDAHLHRGATVQANRAQANQGRGGPAGYPQIVQQNPSQWFDAWDYQDSGMVPARLINQVVKVLIVTVIPRENGAAFSDGAG